MRRGVETEYVDIRRVHGVGWGCGRTLLASVPMSSVCTVDRDSAVTR